MPSDSQSETVHLQSARSHMISAFVIHSIDSTLYKLAMRKYQAGMS